MRIWRVVVGRYIAERSAVHVRNSSETAKAVTLSPRIAKGTVRVVRHALPSARLPRCEYCSTLSRSLPSARPAVSTVVPSPAPFCPPASLTPRSTRRRIPAHTPPSRMHARLRYAPARSGGAGVLMDLRAQRCGGCGCDAFRSRCAANAAGGRHEQRVQAAAARGHADPHPGNAAKAGDAVHAGRVEVCQRYGSALHRQRQSSGSVRSPRGHRRRVSVSGRHRIGCAVQTVAIHPVVVGCGAKSHARTGCSCESSAPTAIVGILVGPTAACQISRERFRSEPAADLRHQQADRRQPLHRAGELQHHCGRPPWEFCHSVGRCARNACALVWAPSSKASLKRCCAGELASCAYHDLWVELMLRCGFIGRHESRAAWAGVLGGAGCGRSHRGRRGASGHSRQQYRSLPLRHAQKRVPRRARSRAV